MFVTKAACKLNCRRCAGSRNIVGAFASATARAPSASGCVGAVRPAGWSCYVCGVHEQDVCATMYNRFRSVTNSCIDRILCQNNLFKALED